MIINFTQIKYLFKDNKEIFLFMVMGVITYYLSVYFSKDWIHYNWMYEHDIVNTTWKSFFGKFSVFKEPLYFILSKAIGHLIGFSAFIFFATVIFLTIKLHYLAKILKDPYLGTFFYVCFYLLLFEGTALRVGYAVALIMPALYYLKEHKFFYAFLLIVAASQIHLTALVFLIAFPLYFFKRLNILVFLAFIFSPLLIISDISVLAIIKEFTTSINPKYLYYFNQERLLVQNSTGLYFYFIAFFAIFLGVIFYYLKDKIINDRFKLIVFSITMCGVVSMCIFNDYVVVGARFGELLLVPIVILLSYLYAQFRSNKMIVHQIGLISFSLMYFVSRLIYLYPKVIGV